MVLSEAMFKAINLINGDDDNSGAVDLTSQAEKALESYTDVYAKFEPLYNRLSSAEIELADIAGELSSLLDKLEVDPKRYDYLNQRNDELRKIKKNTVLI